MELICIACPNGCTLTANQTPEGLVITGNKCPKGEQYGRDEVTAPKRVVTAVVRTSTPDHPCVPVKSEKAVPKDRINDVLHSIYTTEVKLPVRRGDVCISDCCGTGIAIVYTRSFDLSTQVKTS